MSWGSDRGTVTVELAIGIPVMLGVVGLGLGAIRWGMDAVAAVSMAAESLLDVDRGADADVVMGQLSEASRSIQWAVDESADRVCVTGSITSPLTVLGPIVIEQCLTK